MFAICTIVAMTMYGTAYAGPQRQPTREGAKLPAQVDKLGRRAAAIDSPLEVEHAHEARHTEEGGHLPPSRKNVELLGKIKLTDVPRGVGGIWGFKNFAYLNAYTGECPERGRGGVHVVDISNPRNPRKAAFIPAAEDTFATEGVNVIHLENRFFKGDLLVHQNEICGDNGVGGIDIVNVTNPRNPKIIAQGVGDETYFGEELGFVNEVHGTYTWKMGGRAFVVMSDDYEAGFQDVDIMEITNPRKPRLISEVGLPDWPGVEEPLAYADTVFHHEAWVHKDERTGRFRMVVSYWDAGFVMLNVTNPAKPRLIGDYDYPVPDPLTGFNPPEGNAHHAVIQQGFVLGADEDFAPYRPDFRITSGPNVGTFPAGEFGWTVPTAQLPDKTLNGPTVFGGYACTLDHQDPVPPASVLGAVQPGEEKILVVSRGPVADPNHEHEACFFSEKVEAAQTAGYDAVVVANHHVGATAGQTPDSFLCGSKGHEFEVTIRGICVGHRALHLLFGTQPNYQVPYPPANSPENTEPRLGALGARVNITAEFDGWGYAHLIDQRTMQEVDAYAIRQAIDEKFATGFGNFTIHDFHPDPRFGMNLTYASWYMGGLRVLRFGRQVGLRELGHWIGRGINFWGVFALKRANKRPLLLMSDMDYGLYVLRYTGWEPKP